jgi:general secretion pathway protein A
MALRMDDLALVTGSSGTGKSSALRRFTDSLDTSTHPFVYVTAERYKIGELCKQILKGLKIEPPFHGYAALSKFKQEIEKRFKEKNAKPVIIIDEAQELPPETLLSLKNLTNYEMDSNPKLLIILSGHNELATTLAMTRFESLARRIRIRCRIEPLSLEETSRYITHQVDGCGSRKPIFAEEAVARLFSATQGNISQINNLCFAALVVAAADNQPIIGPVIIEKVSAGI